MCELNHIHIIFHLYFLDFRLANVHVLTATEDSSATKLVELTVLYVRKEHTKTKREDQNVMIVKLDICARFLDSLSLKVAQKIRLVVKR